MNFYNSRQNIGIVERATINMLNDLFQIEQTDKETKELVSDIMYIITNEHDSEKEHNLNIQELNKLTLTRIKEIFIENKQEHTNIKHKPDISSYDLEDKTLNENNISCKLNELEKRRQLIPTFKKEDSDKLFKDQSSSHDKALNYSSAGQVVITQSYQNSYKFKTLIINSFNRDWDKNYKRNNLKVNISLSSVDNIILPHCVCFPKFVKNLTPYVLMHVTDGIRNQYYTLTCNSSSSDNIWDLWYTISEPENIIIGDKIWSINFLDFTNNELQLGYDDLIVVSIKEDIEHKQFILLLDKNSDLCNNDNICLKLSNKKNIYTKIIKTNNNIHISNQDNSISIEDLIGAKIINLNKQYTLIVKYALKN